MARGLTRRHLFGMTIPTGAAVLAACGASGGDAIKDTVADVLANKVSAKQALTGVAPAADAALQRSLPK